jgi:hypothetical protein
MSTTVDNILQEARKLTPEQRRELAEALLEEGEEAPAGTVNHDDKEERVAGVEVRRQRLEWLKAHRGEYGGRHVALDGVALVATGLSYREAKEKALSAGKPDVFITYLPKPDEVAEWGGW